MQTWAYDGASWIMLDGGAGLLGSGGELAYDAARDRIVLVPYTFGEWAFVYEFDGGAWEGIPTLVAPTRRFAPALAYDPIRAVTVLWGGMDQVWDQSDTWTWDGLAWEQRFPREAPPVGSQVAMAFDEARGVLQVVPFSLHVPTQTWTWDGEEWLARAIEPRPPDRYSHGVVFDSARQVITVIGGLPLDEGPVDAVWTFDGFNWAEHAVAPHPRVRHGACSAYMEHLGATVLLAGTERDPYWKPVATWRWNGNAWTQPETAPVAVMGGQLAFDQERRELVRIDLDNGGAPRTWIWDGLSWSVRATTTALPATFRGVLAFDEPTRRVVMVTTESMEFSGLHHRTWTWDGVDWTETGASWASGSWNVSLSPGHQGRVWRFSNEGVFRWEGGAWAGVAGPALDGIPGIVAFDSVRGEHIVYVPSEARTLRLRDSVWTEVATALQSPPTRDGAAMWFDAQRGEVVLAGGKLPVEEGWWPATDEVWTWDGQSWQAAPPLPEARSGLAVAEDSVTGVAFLHGGLDLWDRARDQLWRSE